MFFSGYPLIRTQFRIILYTLQEVTRSYLYVKLHEAETSVVASTNNFENKSHCISIHIIIIAAEYNYI